MKQWWHAFCRRRSSLSAFGKIGTETVLTAVVSALMFVASLFRCSVLHAGLHAGLDLRPIEFDAQKQSRMAAQVQPLGGNECWQEQSCGFARLSGLV